MKINYKITLFILNHKKLFSQCLTISVLSPSLLPAGAGTHVDAGGLPALASCFHKAHQHHLMLYVQVLCIVHGAGGRAQGVSVTARYNARLVAVQLLAVRVEVRITDIHFADFDEPIGTRRRVNTCTISMPGNQLVVLRLNFFTQVGNVRCSACNEALHESAFNTRCILWPERRLRSCQASSNLRLDARNTGLSCTRRSTVYCCKQKSRNKIF